MRLNGNEDEKHYDAVPNKCMHTHTHTHAAFHTGVMHISPEWCDHNLPVVVESLEPLWARRDCGE